MLALHSLASVTNLPWTLYSKSFALRQRANLKLFMVRKDIFWVIIYFYLETRQVRRSEEQRCGWRGGDGVISGDISTEISHIAD